MGTKAHEFTCIPREGEPHFVLLGRDPHAYQAVEIWANLREQAIADGSYPLSDKPKVAEARDQARIMREYQMAQPAKRKTVRK